MTILVTGGLGFIGSHVVRELVDHGSTVVATRFGPEAVAPFLEPHVGTALTVEPLDITSPHAVIDVCRRCKVDSIIHLAGTPIGVLSPAEEYRINMAGLLNVVEAARLVGARRVSLASSVAVYMGMNGPLVEDMPARLVPGHAIEAFKKAEELLGLYLASAGGTEVIALRLASIWGPLYRSLRHWPAQLVHAGVAGTAAPLPSLGLPPFHRDDHATDLCYVADAARGVRLVHEANTLRHSAYNIGGAQDVTYGRFADAARAVFSGIEIAMADGTSAANWPDSTFDLHRVEADAGYRPEYSIEQGMEDYAAWLRAGHAV